MRPSHRFIPWSVAVTTAPRPVPALADSLRSIVAAGWPNVFIFAEKGTDKEASLKGLDDEIEGLLWIQHKRVWGPWNNLILALENLTLMEPWAEYYLIFQDDVQVTESLRPKIEQDIRDNAFDKTGVISLYAGRKNHFDAPGWHYRTPYEMPRYAHQGAQAYAFDRELAQEFIQHAPNRKQFACADVNTGRFCRRRGYGMWFHSPSFVRHTGVGNSALSARGGEGPEGERQCAQFMEVAK